MTIDIKEAPHTRRGPRAGVPKTMRAAAIERFGGPEVLTVLEVLVPELEPGEVLIELNTAGVGGWDADMREGWWPNGHPKLPLIVGTDGSGIRIGYPVSFRYCRISAVIGENTFLPSI